MPSCSEENGIMKRANRTVREALEEIALENRYQTEGALTVVIHP